MSVEIRDKNGLLSKLGRRLLITTHEDHHRIPLISSSKHSRRKFVYMPFERGESRDHAYIKIFYLVYKIAVHGLRQDKTIFCCRY
jgi:hypothetical protein